MKYHAGLDDYALRQLVDTHTIFGEWKRAEDKGDLARARSLRAALHQANRLNRALQLGQAPSSLIRALQLAEPNQQLGGLWPMHVYALIAGVRFKPAALPRRDAPVQFAATSGDSIAGLVISSFGHTGWARAPEPERFAREFEGTPSGTAVADLLAEGLIQPHQKR